MYHMQIGLSDVERGVYESLDLRVARHPSESARFLLTRILAYCLAYEEGITFSKGGLSSTEDPPVFVRDPTGVLTHWLEVGSPSAERLHKAAKACPQVSLWSHIELSLLRKEAASRPIHRLEEIQLFLLPPSFLDQLDQLLDRNCSLELLRNDGRLYVTIGGTTCDCELEPTTLLSDQPRR